jgi:hypothetical protein
MYISGHLEIVDDIVKTYLPADYFDSNLKLKQLKKGIVYVDAPCGSYEIKNNDNISIRRVCELSKMLRLFNGKTFGESKMFQFHKGYFTHLHAMTTDPSNSMLKIRNKIIMSILGYSILSIYDDSIYDPERKIKPNAFWAGIILHIITDSYSPAHTIRNAKIPMYKIPSSSKDQGKDEDKEMRLRVHEYIKTLAKKEDSFPDKQSLLQELNNEFQQDALAKQFMNSMYQRRSLWKIYNVFKFEYDTNRFVKSLAKEWNINIDKKTGYSKKEIEGDIVAFQYYDSQPFYLHMRLDLLSYLNENEKLYKRMISECVDFLKSYKEAITTGNVEKYLKDVFKIMMNRTFRIHNKYLKNDTSRIVEAHG